MGNRQGSILTLEFIGQNSKATKFLNDVCDLSTNHCNIDESGKLFAIHQFVPALFYLSARLLKNLLHPNAALNDLSYPINLRFATTICRLCEQHCSVPLPRKRDFVTAAIFLAGLILTESRSPSSNTHPPYIRNANV